MKKYLRLLLIVCTSLLLNSCGGGSTMPPPPVATQLSVNSSAAPVAGTALNINVSALDASGALVATYSGTVHFTSSDAQAVLPPDSPLTGGTKSFSVTFKTAGSQTITVSASGLSPGNSPAIAVSPGAANHFSVGSPATAAAHKVFNFTVTALDASENIATGYSGTAHFTSSDAQAALPANSSLTSGTGTATFPATLVTLGNQTITATDTAMSSITGTSLSIALQALSISSGPLPNGTLQAEYGSPQSVRVPGTHRNITGFFFKLTATGGTGSYSWSWAAAASSSIPPGLLCCEDIVRADCVFNVCATVVQVPDAVFGTPTRLGNYNVVVTVKDTATPPNTSSTNYMIVVNNPPPPVMNSAPTPPIATLNSPYAGVNFTATGGLLPYTAWTETGMLPQGMAFDSATGVLSGTPTAAGSFPIAIKVTDSAGQNSVPQDYTIQVLPTGFKLTGSMSTERLDHTATLLCNLAAPLCNNTKVLVTGFGPAADLYDPSTGTFTPTGSMTTSRYNHTATLLNNGKVLVTGGEDALGNAIATAEVFDPTSGTFSPTGTMGTARLSHTATLLKDGRVLVTGGLPAEGIIGFATAEIFDPGSGTFTPTGSMETGRFSHTATLLKDGTVLVVGSSSGATTETTELFDPASGTFAPAGNLAAC